MKLVVGYFNWAALYPDWLAGNQKGGPSGPVHIEKADFRSIKELVVC
jgi:hypothetical protein